MVPLVRGRPRPSGLIGPIDSVLDPPQRVQDLDGGSLPGDPSLGDPPNRTLTGGSARHLWRLPGKIPKTVRPTKVARRSIGPDGRRQDPTTPQTPGPLVSIPRHRRDSSRFTPRSEETVTDITVHRMFVNVGTVESTWDSFNPRLGFHINSLSLTLNR